MAAVRHEERQGGSRATFNMSWRVISSKMQCMARLLSKCFNMGKITKRGTISTSSWQRKSRGGGRETKTIMRPKGLRG
jgi:hypothetical protein